MYYIQNIEFKANPRNIQKYSVISVVFAPYRVEPTLSDPPKTLIFLKSLAFGMLLNFWPEWPENLAKSWQHRQRESAKLQWNVVYSVGRELSGRHKLKLWFLLYVLYFLTVGWGGGGGTFFEAFPQFKGTAILYWVYCTVHNVQETPKRRTVQW